MKLIPRNPKDGIYPATADYMHGLEVKNAQRILYISGTMGLRPDGVPGADLTEQLSLIWLNICRILLEADMSVDNVVRVTSYLRDPSYAQENQDARVAALNGRVIPCTTIVAQTLMPEWLVEIEVIAAR